MNAFRNFFFREIQANGFGLLRVLWGGLVFFWMLSVIRFVPFFYSESGFLPTPLGEITFRSAYRFSLLDGMESTGVWILYFLLLTSALSACVGKWPRISTILTTVLLLSFHERNLFPLGGGDKVLGLLGFLLCITPEIRAFSVERIPKQWNSWWKEHKLLPPLTMPIWPYRLLLWQVIVIYIFSGWEKMTGTMWTNGTAVAAVFHHPHFFRWGKDMADALSHPVFSATISYATLMFLLAWALLLIPRSLTSRLPQWVQPGTLKRTLILSGVMFHIGIFILLDVGAFSTAMLAAYCGLLLEEDMNAIRTSLNITSSGKFSVLFDGKCGFCQRSVFVLKMLDFLHRLSLVDFHNVEARKAVAPELTFEELDKAMHIYLPGGRVEKGFDAFRIIAWHLPALWIAVPFLYIPGIPPIGRRIYAEIAKRRKSCTGDSCTFRP
ncbi:hypothetical protein COU78_01265 [Candidatus Peregrinibacteria bacterium CG10_big_fil_rev_8_21_14_0_10_49_24]|nr:MAG: hypothetical protein COV83_04230 [Candidatus Peregrinibacteria bacterium CG11_big_fil_rev_8_21_14_0_20_49_14]PIR51355.1 MAG: hypothetical protein COU78_01265 [Candidatus Peregrinibacteria bacterium CG10_big_fil_rev_8_21_14_0_10_49_24]PJA68119.1 MAG: hypothetical protein CO157_01080 [Candidatus Peregrinibacteria bacterium CG_4_9_14_3_um_filter_49_12]